VETRFEFKDFLKVFLLIILLYGGFAALFALAPGAASLIKGLPPTASFLIQYVLQFVVLFFPLWIFVVSKYETDLKDFGFTPIDWKEVLKTIFSLYATYLVLIVAISTILTQLHLKLPGYEQQDSYLPLFGADTLGLVVGFLFVSTIAPFLEELLFRGFVYRVFVKTWVPWVGSLFTAILFALAHLQFQTFIPLFILGLLLNQAYKKTGSVWTCVAFHSLNNIIAFSVDIYFQSHLY
jgi:membrane protease YdiL (CAAX protease family)